ncbi:MAG: hypothetical protein ACKO7R_05815 [Pseudanabaena sp.]
MSSYFSIYTCERCKHLVSIGFIGKESNRTVAICNICAESFYVYPEQGEEVNNSNQPHKIYVRGKKWVEVSSKKGRIKKTVSQDAWIDIGIRIPVQEDIILKENNLHIVYKLVFDNVECPNCKTKGSLVDYLDYVEHCPKCKGKMIESEL